MKPRRRHYYPANPDSSKPETQRRYKEKHGQPGFYLRGLLLDMARLHQKWGWLFDDQEDAYWLWANAESPQLSQDLFEEAKSLRDTLERLVSVMELAQELTPEYEASRKTSGGR